MAFARGPADVDVRAPLFEDGRALDSLAMLAKALLLNMDSKGNSKGNFKHFLYPFLIAVVVYVGFFSCDKHLRERKGPWEVRFQTDSFAAPAIIVDQPALRISNLKIIFPENRLSVTNLLTAVAFDSPLKQSPFGKVIFHDLMYLPGTVTFDLFGHEIELLPRVLIIDHQEHPWRSDATIELHSAESLPFSHEKK